MSRKVSVKRSHFVKDYIQCYIKLLFWPPSFIVSNYNEILKLVNRFVASIPICLNLEVSVWNSYVIADKSFPTQNAHAYVNAGFAWHVNPNTMAVSTPRIVFGGIGLNAVSIQFRAVQGVFSISKLVLKITAKTQILTVVAGEKLITFRKLKKKVYIFHFYQFNNAGIVLGRVSVPHGTAGISWNLRLTPGVH